MSFCASARDSTPKDATCEADPEVLIYAGFIGFCNAIRGFYWVLQDLTKGSMGFEWVLRELRKVLFRIRSRLGNLLVQTRAEHEVLHIGSSPSELGVIQAAIPFGKLLQVWYTWNCQVILEPNNPEIKSVCQYIHVSSYFDYRQELKDFAELGVMGSLFACFRWFLA